MTSNFYTNVQHHGNYVLFRGLVNGKRFKKRLDYKPRLYTLSKNRDSKFKTLEGQPLDEIEFNSINDCKEFKARYKDISSFKIFGDNRHEYSFISDNYNNIDWDYNSVVVAYIDIEVGSENGFPQPEAASEPITAITLWVNGSFYVFGYGNGTGQTYTTTRKDVIYKLCSDEKQLIREFMLVWIRNYPDVVTGWNACRSLMMGNANAGFDFTYMINRMERLFMGANGEDLIKKLSPWGWVRERTVHVGKEQIQYYEISGIAMIDYIDLYKKFSSHPSQESYKLDYIGSVEVGTKKIDYSEYEDLYTLYKKNYQKFIEYNIGDVELVMKIEAKNALIEQIMTLAYDARVNYEDVFSQVRMWDTIVMNDLKHKGIMMPPRKENIKNEQFIGGYVKEPIPGMYDWVASFDFTSLYPHLIMMFNISPETLVSSVDFEGDIEEWMNQHQFTTTADMIDLMLEKKIDTSFLKENQMCLTPNKQLFRTDIRGFLGEIMDRMYKDRAKYKSKQNEQEKILEKTTNPVNRIKVEALIARYKNLQSSKKICLNSAFGAVGNQYFRFFDIRIAEAITTSARLSVRFIQKRLNEYINKYTNRINDDYVIASDTDSVYITFKAIVDKTYTKDQQLEMGAAAVIKSLDKVCEKIIAPQVNNYCQELADYVNAYEQKLVMKREALADKAIWIRKKNYMINIYNNEGVEYAKPKLKMVGIAAIKSSTPGICRTRVKEAYEIIMSKNVQALREFNDTFKKEFISLPVQDIASPLGMHGLEKYDGGSSIFIKKTPAHVKGALVFNHLIKKHDLLKKYQLIKEGEKLKYIYLKEPNPIQSNVISFTTVVPKELGLEQYFDYEKMFEKTYMNQITRVTDVINWELEEYGTLEDLFD